MKCYRCGKEIKCEAHKIVFKRKNITITRFYCDECWKGGVNQ